MEEKMQDVNGVNDVKQERDSSVEESAPETMVGEELGSEGEYPECMDTVKIPGMTNEEFLEAMNQLFVDVQDVVTRYKNSEFILTTLSTKVRDDADENKRLVEVFREENKKLATSSMTRIDKAFASLEAAANIMSTSNKYLMDAIADEIAKFNKKYEKIIFGIGIEAAKKVDEKLEVTLQNFHNELEEINKQHMEMVDNVQQNHQKIVAEVQKVYSYTGLTQTGIWIWRWVMLVTMLLLIQNVFKVDSVLGWIKIITGVGLFC